jgi:F0F1-type ATP synthase assembly protein I
MSKENNKKTNRNKSKKYLDSYARYTSIAFQMLAIILVGVIGGIKLDEWLELTFPVFTVILTILSVILAIYYTIKDFVKTDKDKRKDNNKK